MASISSNSRFCDVNIDKLLQSAINSNTQKSENHAWSLLEKFCLHKPFMLPSSTVPVQLTIHTLFSLTITDLDCVLATFFASLRKENGTLLKKNSLDSIKYAINRRLKSLITLI